MQGEAQLIKWLLEADTPTIRYRTLRNLLRRPVDDRELIATQQAIMQDGPVPHILAQQLPDGQWPYSGHYYTPKYVSTHWSLLLLTELAVDPQDAGFQRGVEYMLATIAGDIQQQINYSQMDIACLWANILRYALHAGRMHDARTVTLIENLLKGLQNGFCACPHNAGLSCAWGVIRTLYGLAAIPTAERTIAINVAIEQAVGFVLERFSLEEANYPTPPEGKIHPLWFKLNFPLFYQTDILFTLRVLAELGALHDKGTQPALDWLAGKRLKNGRWRGSNPFGGRTWPLGDKAETNRWATLFATEVLTRSAH